MVLSLKINHPISCWRSLFLLNWIGGSFIVYIAKNISNKIGTSICSTKFLLSEFAFDLYISAIQHWLQFCFHIWVGRYQLLLLEDVK